MAFGDNIKQLRLDKGLTQEQVANELGYPTNTYVSDVERGMFIHPPDKLRTVAQAFGLTC